MKEVRELFLARQWSQQCCKLFDYPRLAWIYRQFAVNEDQKRIRTIYLLPKILFSLSLIMTPFI